MRLFFILVSTLVFTTPLVAWAEDAVVRFTITNGGKDVGDKGKYFIYPEGERKKELGYAYSGEEAKVPEGAYDVLLRYQDGSIKKDVWREKKALAGIVEEFVEMDVELARVKYTLTNNGVAIGNKGRFLIYPVDDRKNELADESSGSVATVASGVYDVLLKYKDGSVKKELRLQRQKLEGNVDKTIDVSVNLAEVVVDVTRLGQPSRIAWCGVYAPGEKADPVARGTGGEILQVAEGTYDIGCFYNDANISTEQWLKNQAVKGRSQFKVAFDFQRTTLKVLPPPGVEPASTSVSVYAPGDRKRPVAQGTMGERFLFASGMYDVVLKLEKRPATTWPRVSLEGEVVVPYAEVPPNKSLKNVTILSPEPGPQPVLPAPTPEPQPTAGTPSGSSSPPPVVPEAPEVLVTSDGPPPQTLPPWGAVKAEKKKLGGCGLTERP